MKQLYATITCKQEHETTIYRHQQVQHMLRGNVMLYTFALQNTPYKLAVYNDKVYIYAQNSLQYKLKLQLHKEIKNCIYSAYGKLFMSAKLHNLRYTHTKKHMLQLKYNLNFSGYKQDFYLLLQEE